MLLKVRLETQGLFPGATVILGFLSVFKRSQALLPFESLNSAFLSSVKELGGLLSRGVRDLGLFLESPQGIQTTLHLVR